MVIIASKEVSASATPKPMSQTVSDAGFNVAKTPRAAPTLKGYGSISKNSLNMQASVMNAFLSVRHNIECRKDLIPRSTLTLPFLSPKYHLVMKAWVAVQKHVGQFPGWKISRYEIPEADKNQHGLYKRKTSCYAMILFFTVPANHVPLDSPAPSDDAITVETLEEMHIAEALVKIAKKKLRHNKKIAITAVEMTPTTNDDDGRIVSPANDEEPVAA
jgi:hypothetical protein